MKPLSATEVLEAELAHLVRLCTRKSHHSDNAHAQFRKLAWGKALRLQADPDFSELPSLLKAAMQKDLPKSGPEALSTGEPNDRDI